MMRHPDTSLRKLALVGLLLLLIGAVGAWPSSRLLVVSAEPRAQGQGSAAGAMNSLTAAETSAGWKLLFDGRTLSGWSPMGDADWKVEDGTITFTKGRGPLATTQSFANFELNVDFWAEKTANTGVFVRCTPVGTGTASYEINIFDTHETAPTGSIINVRPGSPPTPAHSVLPDRPNTAEKWNSYEITANGTHLVVKLNGTTTSDIQEEQQKLVSGTIQLQAGGPGGPGAAKFRNIKIRLL